MKSSKLVYGCLILFCFSVIAGCASVPLSPGADDIKGKSFIVPPGKSYIYVYRTDSGLGASPTTVAFDGHISGQVGTKNYLLFEVEPGSHEVTSLAENQSSLKLLTESGKAYFILLHLRMGYRFARARLWQVDEKRGHEGVMRCRRVRSE